MTHVTPGQLYLAALFVLLVLYPIYDWLMVRKHLRAIGEKFCSEGGFEFVEIGHSKSHFSVIYRIPGSGKRHYAKFILHTSLGRLRRVDWLT
jgi:hypothetical protein